MEKIEDDRKTTIYLHGKKHCENGPAVLWKNGGGLEWWNHGLLHRLDGPAIEREDGNKEWFVNGLQHRENGPARIYANGTKKWLQKGELHRDDGPAIEWSNGQKQYFLHGKEYGSFDFFSHRLLNSIF